MNIVLLWIYQLILHSGSYWKLWERKYYNLCHPSSHSWTAVRLKQFMTFSLLNSLHLLIYLYSFPLHYITLYWTEAAILGKGFIVKYFRWIYKFFFCLLKFWLAFFFLLFFPWNLMSFANQPDLCIYKVDIWGFSLILSCWYVSYTFPALQICMMKLKLSCQPPWTTTITSCSHSTTSAVSRNKTLLSRHPSDTRYTHHHSHLHGWRTFG